MTSGGGSAASIGRRAELRNVTMKRAVEPGISSDRIFPSMDPTELYFDLCRSKDTYLGT